MNSLDQPKTISNDMTDVENTNIDDSIKRKRKVISNDDKTISEEDKKKY